MNKSRIQGRFILAALAIVLAGACAPLTGVGTSPALPTPTQPATPEIFSPTALPVTPTPTPVAATEAPAISPSPSAVPIPQVGECAPAAIDPALMGPFTWVAYCDTRYGFGFRYPKVGDAYKGDGLIILPMVLGTNLHEKRLQVTVTGGAPTCTSPQTNGYEPGSIPTESVSFNGTTFIKESGADAGAGNIYEWTGYSAVSGSLCVSMTFILHSVNRLNYDTPPPEFDPVGESAVFPAIMSTFTWTGS